MRHVASQASMSYVSGDRHEAMREHTHHIHTYIHTYIHTHIEDRHDAWHSIQNAPIYFYKGVLSLPECYSDFPLNAPNVHSS